MEGQGVWGELRKGTQRRGSGKGTCRGPGAICLICSSELVLKAEPSQTPVSPHHSPAVIKAGGVAGLGAVEVPGVLGPLGSPSGLKTATGLSSRL